MRVQIGNEIVSLHAALVRRVRWRPGRLPRAEVHYSNGDLAVYYGKAAQQLWCCLQRSWVDEILDASEDGEPCGGHLPEDDEDWEWRPTGVGLDGRRKKE